LSFLSNYIILNLKEIIVNPDNSGFPKYLAFQGGTQTDYTEQHRELVDIYIVTFPVHALSLSLSIPLFNKNKLRGP
jgi:hypothetical protein